MWNFNDNVPVHSNVNVNVHVNVNVQVHVSELVNVKEHDKNVNAKDN